jgi:hypothetical protein
MPMPYDLVWNIQLSYASHNGTEAIITVLLPLPEMQKIHPSFKDLIWSTKSAKLLCFLSKHIICIQPMRCVKIFNLPT